MATVYVAYKPGDNGKAPGGLLQATLGKDQPPVGLLPVDVGSERLNVIQAAGKAGVLVPHYCWHPALTVVASCRMCLVEVGERKPDGTVVLQPKVVPGCQTPVKDGTVIVPASARARTAQEQTLEGLLLNHPLDCPVCDKAGECLLQDYSYGFGRSQSRMIDRKNTPPNKPHIGPNVTLFTDRCIMCSRCVRFTREVSGTAELQVVNRGDHSEIDVFPGAPLDNKLASNVVDLCPVGALCSKDFLYKHRVWNLKTQNSVCADCSTGCSIHLDGNKNIVYRLRPRYNPQAQGHFMCDEGRLGYHYVNSKERFLRPLRRRDGQASSAEAPLVAVSWGEALAAIRSALQDAAGRDASAVVGVLSPFLTCEEAFLLAKYLKGLSGQVRLALGPVPVLGADDTYPKDRRGRPVQPVKFTIRAEKCPNRRGVEEVLRHFQGEVIGFDAVVRDAAEGRARALYLAASYPPRPGGWVSAEQAQALRRAPLVVLQDLLPSPVSAFAPYVLPGAAWAEKDGTFVNHAGLAQAIRWAVTPAGECRTDGQVFLDLLGRQGLVHAPTVRAELAREVPAFAPLAEKDLGEYGIPLQAPTPHA
jgi:NADH-quinone oxidoreductase subunit G